MAMVYLLDVNLLLAVDNKLHPHHDDAQRWFKHRIRTEQHRWATCPITENGFIRIASNPNYPQAATYGTVADTTAALAQLCTDTQHEFWTDNPSLRDAPRFDLSRVAGPRQLTDVYLLALAIEHGERLATLEQNFPAAGVPSGLAALERVDLLPADGTPAREL